MCQEVVSFINRVKRENLIIGVSQV